MRVSIPRKNNIDRRFENEDGELIFSVKAEAQRDTGSRIQMRNVDSTVEGLIDRAIMQRTKPGNGDA